MSDRQAEQLQGENIVRAASIGPHGVYFIGPPGRKLSFAAQQQRALNLVWALNDRALIVPGDRAAVVGGGFSGLTAAMALSAVGCEVSLFEPSSRPLSIESQSNRRIHPTIAQWPGVEPSITTNFPFLEWSTDTLTNVAGDLFEEARATLGERIFSQCEVERIDLNLDGTVSVQTVPRRQPDRFRVIIVTDDIGREREQRGINSPSYWHPDNLETARDTGRYRRFVISGCGDGGLTDALRLAHVDYRGGQLVIEVAEELAETAIAEMIRNGESLARSSDDPAILSLLYLDAARHLAEDTVYGAVAARLRQSLRGAPDIVLTDGFHPTPFDGSSAPIHKLLIAHAMHLGMVHFRHGAVTTEDDTIFVAGERVAGAEAVCLVRHGVTSRMAHLFSPRDLDDHFRRARLLEEKPFEPIWHEPFPVPARYAKRNLADPAFLKSRLPLAHRAVAQNYRAHLSLERGGFRILADENTSLNLPDQLFGIPTRVSSVQSYSSIDEDQLKPVRVMLSYAYADQRKADAIAQRFAAAGLDVIADRWAPEDRVPTATRLSEQLSSCDVLLVLVSPSSLTSSWIQLELGAIATMNELRDRNITVVPALIEPCALPLSLQSYRHIVLTDDLIGGVDRLIEQLSALPLIDLSKIDWDAFGRLITDLLGELGFRVLARADRSDPTVQADFEASFESVDPFGATQVSKWDVVLKHRRTRLSVGDIAAIHAALLAVPGQRSCLLVTSSRLTSVAREFLDTLALKSGGVIRIVDSQELAGLLVQRPHLVRRHLVRMDRP